jgi:hypothetical protein
MKFVLVAIVLSAALTAAGCAPQTTGYSGAYGSASGYAGKPNALQHCHRSVPPNGGCPSD